MNRTMVSHDVQWLDKIYTEYKGIQCKILLYQTYIDDEGEEERFRI